MSQRQCLYLGRKPLPFMSYERITRKKVTRRRFLKTAGALAGAAAITGIASRYGFDLVKPASASVQLAQTPLPGKNIPKFLTPLPHFATRFVGGSPVSLRVLGNTLTVTMEELQQYILPQAYHLSLFPVGSTDPLKNGAWVWGYKINDGTSNYGPNYPGFTVEATRGTPKMMTYANNLPASGSEVQIRVTVDQTLHWADPLLLGMPPMGTTCNIGGLPTPGPSNWCLPYTGPPPAVVHLHGGEVRSDYDGGPDQWFTPIGLKGNGYRTRDLTDLNKAVYEYLNQQEPATLWFHDHALGATRLNVYGGMAAFYLLRDPTIERPDLPGGPGDTATVLDYSGLVSATPVPMKAEVELAIQDRVFDTQGQLYFPDIGINPEHPYWVPEFFGDAIVVNGKSWPVMQVEPRRYRFRFLDGCNARFLELRLMNRTTKMPGPAFWQIGTDGGLMDTPVKLNDPAAILAGLPAPRLLLAPGERADVIIDFSGYGGQTLTLMNSAKAPYPKGAAADPSTVGQIMQFIVGATLSNHVGPTGDPSYDPASLASPRLTLMDKLVNFATGTLAAGVTSVQKRQLTLNEVMGMGGPLEVLVNNTKWAGKRMELKDGMPMMMPRPDFTQDVLGNYLSELPANGSIEVWEIINLTADAHPIHLHLVQFQLLNRQLFNVRQYNKKYAATFPVGYDPVAMMTVGPGVFIPAFGPPMDYSINQTPLAPIPTIGGNPDVTRYLQGAPRPPDPNEAGWKDTVKMYPGEVTRIVVRFKKQDGTPFGFDATGATPVAYNKNGVLDSGPGYVWHCHIIDHEDNEMMRPYHPV